MLAIMRVDPEGKLVLSDELKEALKLAPGKTFAVTVMNETLVLTPIEIDTLEIVAKDPAWAFWRDPEEAEYGKKP